ncbi:sensor histidine kinase [Bacillus taeanensis]|uniref:histidine kinase n=1 Tax=Bacillus taeanensis TaxID=273032 RepID=A0A366XYW8_9BACI|nr:HAMP domain-containing sensor histidine kinase [Bacillus taeanensis]RBW69343.1 sensor histidine kinase [Bacillus taeanensis]
MKQGNLTKRIWLSFILLIVFVGLLIAIIYPLSIKGTLTEESYQIIEQEQQLYMTPYLEELLPYQSEKDFIERRDAARSVGHLLIVNQYRQVEGDPIPDKVLQEMGNHAFKQKREVVRYELTYDEATLLYVIRNVEVGSDRLYLVSYMWDTYRDQMVQRLWQRLLLILLIAIFVSLIPAIWLSLYLRHPLAILGKRFEQISKRNWQEPFLWEGDKEFEVLSHQFEAMRQNLMRYDQSQKTFIQHASHELKTPIMIIQSYAQSIQDGILPKKTMNETMEVIISEANRMEKRVKDMLYFTKLDALKEEEPKWETLHFYELTDEIIERFQYHRDDLSFYVRGENAAFKGDYEQWQILLENLIQNAIRYAEDEIIISATQAEGQLVISVQNNGEKIPEEDLERLFTPFQKGNKGQFGLGLAIVKRIAELHNGKVEVRNMESGVCFTITFSND